MNEKPCPNCGHCPTCGRAPVPYWHQWPAYSVPHYLPNVPAWPMPPTFISTGTFSLGDVVAVAPAQTVRK